MYPPLMPGLPSSRIARGSGLVALADAFRVEVNELVTYAADAAPNTAAVPATACAPAMVIVTPVALPTPSTLPNHSTGCTSPDQHQTHREFGDRLR